MLTTFQALNHYQERTANGGNQFSVEPPDQGMCVGNGSVLETINDVTRVYNATSGTATNGVSALNTFYGYAPAILRTSTPRVFGPFVTDPTCLYDTATQRWFMVVLTLDTNPATGSFTGNNHLDIAVSQSSDPTQAWTIYRVNVNDDGTNGTPNHMCTYPGSTTGFGPCFGDYPHIGADTNGFYITTNEYSFFGPEFHGAQVYAFSKAALVANHGQVVMTQFDTHGLDNLNSGFTLAPATSTGGNGSGETANGGTEYLMSSNAADEAHGNGTAVGPRSSTQLLVWALTNTRALGSQPARLVLSHTVSTVPQYSAPSPSVQKDGSAPLLECLNDTQCARTLNGQPDKYKESLAALDSGDTRMLQVTYANGKLWGALDSAVTVGSSTQAGIAWYIVTPGAGTAAPVVTATGDLGGLNGDNLLYPAIGPTSTGHAVMGFTVVGPNTFPSAGYASLDVSGAGAVQIAAAGAGAQDGFSGYNYYNSGAKRPRWGDYGASAVDEAGNVWLASEYIAQTCTLSEWLVGPLHDCNQARTTLANWATRISEVSPG